jgi:DNA invertase Pin-like site-specific DNA recombinase
MTKRIGFGRQKNILDFGEQFNALVEAGCSGKDIYLRLHTQRIVTDKLLRDCLAEVRQGDTLVIYSLDRFSNSFRAVARHFLKLNSWGVNIEVLHPQIRFDASEAGLARIEMLQEYLNFSNVVKAQKEHKRVFPRIKHPKSSRPGPANALRASEVEEIRQKLKLSKVNISALAQEYSVARNTMYACIRKIRSETGKDENAR